MKPTTVMKGLSGRRIVSLMRKNKVTIRELSRRMQITQKRIRQVRESGLSEPNAIRDWVEAITGIDPGPVPQRYRIRRYTEEAVCCHCGCPLYVGEYVIACANETFCSGTCCRQVYPAKSH